MRQRILTADQQRAAEERRQRFRAMAREIAQLSPAARDALAAKVVGIATVEGHAISPANRCMIAAQNPSATIIGGFRQWKRAGRSVRKGEHGMAIWVPRFGGKEENPAGGADVSVLEGFILATVFDVSQTEEVQHGGAAEI